MLDKAPHTTVVQGATDPLLDTARRLQEARRTLQGVESAALSGTAAVLVEAAERLSRTAKDLADMQALEWMTAEQAASYLGFESVAAFEKVVARERIPKHYVSARAPRYNRVELDAWLMDR